MSRRLKVQLSQRLFWENTSTPPPTPTPTTPPNPRSPLPPYTHTYTQTFTVTKKQQKVGNTLRQMSLNLQTLTCDHRGARGLGVGVGGVLIRESKFLYPGKVESKGTAGTQRRTVQPPLLGGSSSRGVQAGNANTARGGGSSAGALYGCDITGGRTEQPTRDHGRSQPPL